MVGLSLFAGQMALDYLLILRRDPGWPQDLGSAEPCRWPSPALGDSARADALPGSSLARIAPFANWPSRPPTPWKQRDQDLEALRAEQKKAAEAEAKLKAEIEAIGEDRRKLNQALIDTAARIRVAETRIAAGEARRTTLADQERAIRQSLDGRRAVIAEVLAALQRIGHRPPPALMVRPEDALQSVRTAMLLGAVLPEMRAEAETLDRRPRRAHPCAHRDRGGARALFTRY